MKNKFLIFLMSVVGANLVLAQSTDHIWINEVHYNELSTGQNAEYSETEVGNGEIGEFIELVVHNDIMDNPAELAKFQIVLYAANGMDMTENSPIGKGLPYHMSSRIYSADDSVHPLSSFDRCAGAGGVNYSFASKVVNTLQDLPSAIGIVYDNSTVIQLLSYGGRFKIKNDIDAAGPAAGLVTSLIGVGNIPGDESAFTDPQHSLQLQGGLSTNNSYDDYVWVDELDGVSTIMSPKSPCAKNSSQEIADLAAYESGIVPIALIDLIAVPQEKTIDLEWRTATEIGNKGFHIERRLEKANRFETIAFVKSKGNSTNVTAYEYVDKDVKKGETYIYRLRQEDESGEFDYSAMVSARLAGNVVTMLANPNPAQNTSVVTLENISQATTLKVTGVDGRVVYEVAIAPSTTQTIELNVNDWAKGMYLIRIENDGETLTEKLTVF